jgi:ribosome-associated protein
MSNIPANDTKILQCICQSIFNKKGFNILSLDVRGMSNVADYYVIAEGNVEKHVQALARDVCDAMLTEGVHVSHIEGQKEGDWIVVDFSDVVVHLFIPEMREKYALEELWQKASIVNVPIETRLASESEIKPGLQKAQK